MLHDEIARRLPNLRPLLRWHLVGTNGPMHYKTNTMYWAGFKGYCDGKPNSPPNWEHFKNTAVWGACPSMDTGDPCERFSGQEAALTEWLDDRQDEIMREFRRVIESLEFVY